MKIEPTWKEALKEEFEKPYFKSLREFVRTEYQNGTVYPPASKIFAAFDATPIDEVKVVIIGQDPYHGPNQAEGLCFSVEDGMKHPPSLVNIFKEIQSDLGKGVPQSGSLSRWASQGVLPFECHANSESERSRVTSEKRVGRIYGCRDTVAPNQKRARLFVVGKLCPKEGTGGKPK